MTAKKEVMSALADSGTVDPQTAVSALTSCLSPSTTTETTTTSVTTETTVETITV